MAVKRTTTKRAHGALEKKLGYKFKGQERLTEALTHRSFRYENDGVRTDNERLEFLGDAVLCVISAACIYQHHPEMNEGEMTALRSRVISGKSLAICAAALELGECLRMGMGEERSGGRHRPTNLANAMEAVIGAAFLDGGLKAAQKVFDQAVRPRLDGAGCATEPDNPKGALQEFAQARWKSSPTYAVIAMEGPAHATVFTVRATLPDGRTATASGRSKQAAESEAASMLLQEVHAAGEPET